jgi:AraC family transcriptional regulator
LLLLMRGVAATTSRDVTATEMTILGLLVERLQRKFEKLIQRSPGQNASRKKAAFMRVQRTRNLISFGVGSRFDVRSLAHMANYSVWHFIHVYNCVFGETPYVHISRLRMDQAKNLIRMNERCMSEIAQSVGFDSRTTLTRAIKKRYGVCASQLRHATDL